MKTATLKEAHRERGSMVRTNSNFISQSAEMSDGRVSPVFCPYTRTPKFSKEFGLDSIIR
jgi:hypothetical protein